MAATVDRPEHCEDPRPSGTGAYRRYLNLAVAFIAGGVLAGLVIAMGPLYVCMPPWVDTTFFDITAKSVLAHEAVYREYLLHGPPGMLLVQSLFRWLIGWSSEALRLLDLFIIGGIIAWLARTVPARRGPAVRLCTALALAYFYFGATTEWSHCQTDTWMLVPSIVALVIHKRRFMSGAGPQMASALAEGICWGIAFSIKPFVVCPALACWLVTIVASRKVGRSWGTCLGEFAAMVLGGLLVGAATVSWLYTTGNWPSFVEAAFSDWNRDYWANSPPMTERPGLLLEWFWPWNLIHLITGPASIAVIARFCYRKAGVRRAIGHSQVLLAAFYLGWFFQANVLQRQLPYHLMPTILLALPLLFGIRWLRCFALTLLLGLRWLRVLAPPLVLSIRLLRFWAVPLLNGIEWFCSVSINLLPLCEPVWRWAIIAVFLYCTWSEQYGIRAGRLHWWGDCWAQGSTPLMRARLSLEPDMAAPDWLELDQVRQFLAKQHLRDGELNCYAVSALSLYLDLNLKPGNPYLYGWGTVKFFKHHEPEIIARMIDSPERFVVNDYMQFGYSRELARRLNPRYPRGRLPIHPGFRHDFPWDYPNLFRAGRYLVHDAQALTPGKTRTWARP